MYFLRHTAGPLMKGVQFSLRNLCFLHILFRSIKSEALPMGNHWLGPAGDCPPRSESSDPRSSTSANVNASFGSQDCSPCLSGHSMTPSREIHRRCTTTSSPMENAPSEKGDDKLLHQDSFASLEMPVESRSAGRKRRSELDVIGGIKFKLSESCILVLSQGDITKWHVDGTTDAIVNAANERMLGGGGVDGAIHRAAGPRLLRACRELPLYSEGIRCPVGSAVITEGFNLPVSRIIHTVGPIYMYEDAQGSILRKAFESSLTLAVKHGIKYIAFPAISCGVYGYPAHKAAKVALKAVHEESGLFEEVHFVLFEDVIWKSWLAEADQHFKRLED